MKISPPSPPSPPEGPPRGTYFSRRNATQPSPPSPAFIDIFASSANTYSPASRTGKHPKSIEEKSYARAGGKKKNTRPGRTNQQARILNPKRANYSRPPRGEPSNDPRRRFPIL